MTDLVQSTLPKPFVFVLMPMKPEFDDIYKFGIKGAAEEVGAYAERLDEQIFTEGMLERIFNQISKADVIIADMTGRNPNVFYEVGYAHALGKITLLLTQKADDIPFDLKHRQHTVYGGKIDTLRKELIERLRWAISESQRKAKGITSERITLRFFGVDVPKTGMSKDIPTIHATSPSRTFHIPLQVRNDSYEPLSGITHVYLFTEKNSGIIPYKYEFDNRYLHSFGDMAVTYVQPLLVSGGATDIESFDAASVDSQDNLVTQFRLPITFPAMPPGVVETAVIGLKFIDRVDAVDSLFRLRLHSTAQFHDYSFRLKIDYEAPVEPTGKNR